MKFGKLAFFMTVIIFGQNAAFSYCYSSDPKKYCLTSKRYDCPTGCYCLGASSPNGALDKHGNGKANISNGEVASWCSSGAACPWSESAGQCGTSSNAGVYRCPSGYRSCSSVGTQNDCCTGNITCNAGKYIKAGSGSCSETCPNGSYCPSNSYSSVLYNATKNKNACPALTSGYSYKSGTGWSSLSDCKEVKSYVNISTYCSSGELTKTASSTSAWSTASSTLKAKSGYQVTGSGDNRTCSACGDAYYNTSDSNTSCTACTSVSGWTTHTTSSTATSYTQCYITQTPTNCASGNIKRDFDHYEGSNKVVYKSTPTVKDALSSKPGYYVNGTSCTVCPVGTYYAGGSATSCTAVDSGYCASKDGSTCIGAGKTGASKQIACESGKYSNSERTDCVACTDADKYTDGKQCLSCPARPSTVSVNSGYFKEYTSTVNNGIKECRYGDKTNGCRGNKYSSYAVVYKYDGEKYVLDPERTPYAEKHYYVEEDKCKKCRDLNDGAKPYSIGNQKGPEQCYACGGGQCIIGSGEGQDCKACTAGFECPKKDGAAQPCKQTYVTNFGAYGVNICPKGSFSKPKQSACTSCADGYTTAKVTDFCKTTSSGSATVDSPDTSVVSCCFAQGSSQAGCAIPNKDEDVIDQMCSVKETSLCYFKKSGSVFSCDYGFYWPKGISIGRPDMSVIKFHFSEHKIGSIK